MFKKKTLNEHITSARKLRVIKNSKNCLKTAEYLFARIPVYKMTSRIASCLPSNHRYFVKVDIEIRIAIELIQYRAISKNEI